MRLPKPTQNNICGESVKTARKAGKKQKEPGRYSWFVPAGLFAAVEYCARGVLDLDAQHERRDELDRLGEALAKREIG